MLRRLPVSWLVILALLFVLSSQTSSQHNNECLHNHKTACRQTEDAKDETEDKIADNIEGTSEGEIEGETERKTIEDETEDK